MTNKISENSFTFDSPEDVVRTKIRLSDADISAKREGLSLAPPEEGKPSGCPAGYIEVDGMCVRIS